MVLRELEQGIEKSLVSYVKESQSQAEISINASEPMLLDNSELAQSVVLKFKTKMAVVTSNQDLVFQAAPGTKYDVCWTVQNNSQQKWPCAPVLMNVTTGEKQQLDAILDQNESTEIRYTY